MNKLNYLLGILIFVFLYSCQSEKQELSPNQAKIKMMKEDVVVTTSDNVKIFGTYYYNNMGIGKKEPLVILIHQFMSDRGQWKQDIIDSLLTRNFKVITYDIRNHGESSKGAEDINDILTAKGNAILDIAAVIDWAKKRSGVDSTRVAVVGTSVGGSLGLYAKYYLGTKTTVCISVGMGTFTAFTGISELTMNSSATRKINSVLIICGEKDGSYPDDAKTIYSNFVDDPKELKYFNTDKHGKDLLIQNPDAYKFIFDWLSKYL
jgi:dienelactone hydrolase